MKKRLIKVSVHDGYCFFVFLHRLIYVLCLKCPPSAQMRVLSRECHWSVDASIVQGAPGSWKVMEFRKIIFQAWKVMENSKGHGKSWKLMMTSWNFYYALSNSVKVTQLHL